ncbi:MAG: 50S ribosomal protein L25, partial [Cyanobacteria bacterium P01_H01_bin.130]
MEFSIECKSRAGDIKPKALRREGLVPANLYGHDGTESMLLTVDAHELSFIIRDVKVGETPIEVSVPDASWKGTAVLQEVQAHPWKKGNIYHVSFFAKK